MYACSPTHYSDVVFMLPQSQNLFEHRVPKMSEGKMVGKRYNLTFRCLKVGVDGTQFAKGKNSPKKRKAG
jgi:hypothetical protein